MNLLRYTFQRILFAFPLFFLQITIVFFLSKWVPGNPFMFGLSPGSLNEYQLEQYYENLRLYGFNLPVTTQYIRFLRNLFTGDWGISYFISYQTPVWEMIKYTLPNTVEFLLISLTISYIIGIILGKSIAMKSTRRKENIFRLLTLAGGSLPLIFFSLLFIFAIEHSPLYRFHGGIASFDVGDPIRITGFRILDCILNGQFDILKDTLMHYLLPVLSFSIPITMMVMRQSRSSMLDVLSEDYIRTAHAKGCPDSIIKNKHAFPNALIPTVTYLGISFNIYLVNCMLVENIFDLPGFTRLFVSAIKTLDYNIIIASSTFIMLFSVVASLIVDIIYALVDPRIRY